VTSMQEKTTALPVRFGEYIITEVDAARPGHAAHINAFNSLFKKDFSPLKERHLSAPNCYWWLVHEGIHLVAFAGVVPFEPFPRVGYLKRAAVLPAHRGHGLQARLIAIREERARSSTDWTHLVTETSMENVASANNFIRAGYRLAEAERPWAKETLFWRKAL
jgi:GNAT superfamily N-acetyltransferase